MTQIIKKYGFPVEIHEIETEDGYLLDVYRIPYGRFSRTKRTNTYPVVVNHGLLGSAENFIVMGPNKSLAYMLADYGFDVWLCNARGSWHSRKHRTLNPDKDAEYWQFTWNEIGIYDLPATIDYILNVTNTNKVHFVGHSQGTTTFFVMCSERPEYNKKIKVMIALAPSAILRHFKEPFLNVIIPFYPFLERLADNLEEYELLPFVSNRNIRNLGRTLCRTNRLVSSNICEVMASIFIQDEEMDKDVIPLLVSTAPAGASVKQGLHYAQIVKAGIFRKYDWGPTENVRRYNSRTPPEYNIKNITAPIAIFYGEADVFVTKETQLLNKNGYPMEIHEIETEDGYILDVYRIPYGRRKSVRRINSYPVILTHGLLSTAEMYILMGPDKSLAYMLADNGYDVWLMNTRGSWHSRKHKTLNPDTSKEYWQFSFHEIGIYDLPATIDYILNKTNSHKVHYIGHSQGTTSFFVMCSERPEYNKRITVMVALAPSAILNNFRYPFLRIITPFHRFLERLTDAAEIFELLPFISSENIHVISKMLCGKDHLLPSEICHIILLLLFEDKEMDLNVIPLALSYIPAGGSVKQGLHYAQIIEAGKFQKYDWGPEKNMKKYNSKIPPAYKLENTMVPVAIFYGEADDIVTKEDVEILASLLPNVVEMYKIPSKNWNHFDFIWGKGIDILLNNKIVDVITTYNNK